MNKKSEWVLIVVLYLFCLYLWTLPFQNNRMPYGEVDAGSHFALGDYMAQTDKPIIELPYFIDARYWHDNQYKPHTLWYHPPYHVNFAILQIVGGERVLTIFLFNAILCSIIVWVIFFVIRNLFDFWTAFLASLLMVFSMRDILVYLWGQWPQQIAYFYTPLVLYAFYRYVSSYLDGKPNSAYAYIFAVLLGVNFYLHPAAGFHTIAALAIFSVLLSIKEKKMPFSLKQILLCTLIFVVMLGIFPVQTANMLIQMKGGSYEEKIESPLYHDFSSLFLWFGWKELYSKQYQTQPVPYFDYGSMNGGAWTLPLLFMGIVCSLIRRGRKDLLLLSYLFAIYLMMHLVIFGLAGRPERSLAASAHIFYPFIAVGLVSLPHLLGLAIKIPDNIKVILKYSLIALFIIFIFSFNFKPAYIQLRDAYAGVMRITPVQYEAGIWMKENLPIDANVSTMGVLTMQKDRWMRYVAWRFVYPNLEGYPTPTHVLFDYTDLLAVGQNNRIQDINSFEKEAMANNTLVYNKNNMRVYKLG